MIRGRLLKIERLRYDVQMPEKIYANMKKILKF